jgi:hypothetical protein
LKTNTAEPDRPQHDPPAAMLSLSSILLPTLPHFAFILGKKSKALKMLESKSLGAFAKSRKTSLCLSVRPLVWDKSATTGRIFLKFYI